MKVLITNTIIHNGGDAAILYGMLTAIKKAFPPNTKIKVHVEDPDFCKYMYSDLHCEKSLGQIILHSPLAKIRIIGRRWLKLKQIILKGIIILWRSGIPLNLLPLSHRVKCILEDYRNTDIVISCGGTYLLEEYGIATQILDYNLSHTLRKPLFLYTQSIGRFLAPENIKALSSVFDWCSGIFLRDAASLKHVLEINHHIAEKCFIRDDAAFSLLDLKEFKKHRVNENAKLRVGISIREWIHNKTDGMDRYRKSMARALLFLAEQGHSIVIVSTCQGSPIYTDDNIEIDKICNLLPKNITAKFERHREAMPFQRVQTILASCDFVIATRLHMAIISLLKGIPVLPIAYEFKIEELFLHKLNYKNIWTLENISPEPFCESIKDFIKNLNYYNNILQEKIPSMAENSSETAKLLLHKLGRK